MEQAAILRTQVNNLKATGTLSGGKSLAELGIKELRNDLPDRDLQKLSKAAYEHDPQVAGYTFVPALSDYESKVFVKPGTKDIVIAYKGTDPKHISDLYTDLRLAQGHLSDTSRYQRSKQAVQRVKQNLPGYRITLTGHSLGGSLARAASTDKGVTRAVGFNTGYELPAGLVDASVPFTLASKAVHDKEHGTHPKFRDYLNTNDLVSVGAKMLGKRNREQSTYYSRSWGLKAHRPTYFN